MSNHKKSGENHMSLNKSATRRLSLMAGSALVAAGLSAVLSAGALLAPTDAFAQTVSCVAGVTPVGSGAAVAIPAATYNPGILCTYTGDTATVSTGGAVTVSATGGNPGDPLVNGVNLRASGTDDITWTSTAGTITGGAATNGPIIDALAGGNVTLNLGAITSVAAASSTATHGAFAQSTGGGDVTVTANGSINTASSGANGGSVAGIEARSTGGNGNVKVIQTGNSVVQGRLYGIRAEASGSGDLTIDLQGAALATTHGVSTGNATAAAIYAKTGTGFLRIDVDGRIGDSGLTRDQSAIRLETGGDAEINITSSRMTGLGNAIVDMTTAAGTQTSLTHLGQLGTEVGSLIFRGAGGGNITINSGYASAEVALDEMVGRVDFAAHNGDLTWNLDRDWLVTGASAFGSGNAAVTVAAGRRWISFAGVGMGVDMPGSQTALEAPIIMDFGDGDDDIFVNNGTMWLGPKSTALGGGEFGLSQHNEHMETETRFVGLERFENAGSIYLGGRNRKGIVGTDGVTDDLLLMPGAHFVGSGDSLIVLDVALLQSQSACSASLRNTATTPGRVISSSDDTLIDVLSGEMPAADCVGIQGGSTEGVTRIRLNQTAQGDRGGASRIVLVDVAGGSSEAGHFVLDPETIGYNPAQGGYIDLGYVIMPLVYDADTQQHVLLGTAGQNAWQTSTWAAAALDMWRISTGSWFDRQADLRGDLAEGVGGGMWLRASMDSASRSVTHLQTAGTSSFTFDNSYEQSTYAVTGGADLLIGGGADSAWVVGLMAGYANSEVTYDASPNTEQFDSWNGGLYGSFLAGGLYVDALVNANKADVKADIPGLGLLPTGTVLRPSLLTVGAQIEAGWRLPIAEGLFVEPLVGASWVRTKWDEVLVSSSDRQRPGIDVDFNDPTSLRANVGARVGWAQDYGSVRAQYSVLGRVWNEFEGEHDVTLQTVVDDLFVSDEFTGTVTELGFGASIYGSVVSGFLNIGGKWGDDYESVGGAAGVRITW